MSNYFHDTNLDKCDALCSNCRFGEKTELEVYQCVEHLDNRSRVTIEYDCNWLLGILLWIGQNIFQSKFEIQIFKTDDQYCSEHEFREDC